MPEEKKRKIVDAETGKEVKAGSKKTSARPTKKLADAISRLSGKTISA